MKTLIIDDDIFLQKALSFNLLELGCSVAVASDGQEALNMIEKNRDFDVIFCDVMMPVLTGPGFLLTLKKYFPGKLPNIVVISGLKNGEDFLKKIDIKYDYFVKKPVDLPKLRELVDEMARLKHA